MTLTPSLSAPAPRRARQHRQGWSAVPLLAALALVATACAGEAADDAPAAATQERPEVVATFSIIADLARDVGGEHVEVETIVPVGGDPHEYESTPSDSMALADADLVLDNGLGLNPWFEALESEVGGELVIVTEEVRDEAVEAVTEDEVDPHMWLSPRLVWSYVDVIEDALVDLVPDQADDLADAADEVRAELDDLAADLDERLAAIPEEDRQLVTHEDAFGYFAEAFDFAIVGSAVGPSTEIDPTAAGIADLIDVVQEKGVPAVFPQTTESPDVMERVARDADVRLGDPLHVDSVGEPGSGADDYAGMMRANADILVEGLTGGDDAT